MSFQVKKLTDSSIPTWTTPDGTEIVYLVRNPTTTPSDAKMPLSALATIIGGAVDSVFGRTGPVDAEAGDYTAALITNSPAGGISGATVQSALNELDAEKQPLDGTLTAFAGLVGAADKLPYFTGADVFALADFTAFGRSLVNDADAIAGRTTLGLGSAALNNTGDFATAAQGATADTAVQPATLTAGLATRQTLDATLTAFAALVGAANKLVYFTGDDAFALTDLTAFARTLLDDSDAATARATLGIVATTLDTRANILASTPSNGTLAYATDTAELFVYNSGWYVFPLEADAEATAPDMGLQYPMVDNDKSGYTAEMITDKTLHNVRILENALTSAGAIRTTTSGTFQVYLNGTWNDVVINFRIREDSTGAYEFEHKPVGFTEWIEILSGNGNTLGLNGLPIIQQYTVSMGAYPVNVHVKGRSFD